MTDLDTLAFRFTPADLEDHPHVASFVSRLGYGELVTDTLFSPGGRNLNWAGETSTGGRIFVKSLPPEAQVAADALRRSLAFESTVAAGLPRGAALRSPRLLGHDGDAGLLAYALLPDARGLNAVAVAGELETGVCRQAGAAVGALHGTVVRDGSVDDRPLEMPPVAWLHAMPVEALGSYTMAQTQGWRLMQADAELVGLLGRLRSDEAAAAKVPIHGDLRMDQFLISGDDLYLCDWEFFRLGDGARDVGALIGELLFQAIYLELTRRDDSPSGTEVEIDHAEVMRRGRAGLDRATPLIGAMWSGYLGTANPDPALAVRAVGFAGWHMYDRLLTWAEDSSQLNASAKAIAGIGRQLLLNPGGAALLLGVDDRRTA